MIAQQLIKKYNLAADSYYTQSAYLDTYPIKDEKFGEYIDFACREEELKIKWASNIPTPWYGFNLGHPTPEIWFKVIDEFLVFVKDQYPDFEIYQIKLKMGGIRIYIGNVPISISNEIHELEAVLYDKFLIW